MGPRAGLENLAPTGIRYPDRPVRSKSLYPLSYPGPHTHTHTHKVSYILTAEIVGSNPTRGMDICLL